MQAPEVHRLFLIMRFAGAKDIKAAGPGLYTGQLIQIKEAEAKDEITLVRTDILSQDNFAGAFLVDISQPCSRASSRLAVSTLTRVPGIILPAMISLRLLTQRRMKLALVYCIPVLFLVAWLGYGFLSTGELIAPLAAQEKTVWNHTLTSWSFSSQN